MSEYTSRYLADKALPYLANSLRPYLYPSLNFTASKSDMELITRRVIKDLEGDPDKDLDQYATTDYTSLIRHSLTLRIA
mgnify:CR=1 FL=1